MTSLRRATMAALTTAVFAGSLALRGADSTAAELAAALQKKYNGIKDFSADFSHTYEGGVLHKQITERGHLLVKKPGKMRWDYSTPETKQFVSDGLSDLNGKVTTAKGDVTRDFTPSLVETPAGMPAGSRALKLVPKSRQRDYDWLVLVLDPGTLSIRGLLTVDEQGGKSSFFFTNLKENVGLADKDFTFKIPRGVDVVTAPSRN